MLRLSSCLLPLYRRPSGRRVVPLRALRFLSSPSITAPRRLSINRSTFKSTVLELSLNSCTDYHLPKSPVLGQHPESVLPTSRIPLFHVLPLPMSKRIQINFHPTPREIPPRPLPPARQRQYPSAPRSSRLLNTLSPRAEPHELFGERAQRTTSVAAGSPPHGVSSHSPLATSHCLSNRYHRRLEFLISLTKQRTAVLSNRYQSGVFENSTSIPSPPPTLQPVSLSTQNCLSSQGARITLPASHLCSVIHSPNWDNILYLQREVIRARYAVRTTRLAQ